MALILRSLDDMRNALLALMLLGVVAVPAAADDKKDRRGRDEGRFSIPPGHLPPPGECRVWYPGVPPGHQPPPFRCDDGYRSGGYDRSEGPYRLDGRDYGRYARDRRDVEPYYDEAPRRSGRYAKPRR